MVTPKFEKTLSTLTAQHRNSKEYNPVLRCGYCNKFMSFKKYIEYALSTNVISSHCYHCKKEV
jgi:hypothetical protein